MYADRNITTIIKDNSTIHNHAAEEVFAVMKKTFSNELKRKAEDELESHQKLSVELFKLIKNKRNYSIVPL